MVSFIAQIVTELHKLVLLSEKGSCGDNSWNRARGEPGAQQAKFVEFPSSSQKAAAAAASLEALRHKINGPPPGWMATITRPEKGLVFWMLRGLGVRGYFII